MAAATPKFKSAEFRAALSALKLAFDAHSLGVVLLDALERKSTEQIFKNNAKSAVGAHVANAPKSELIGQITAWFFASEEVAFQVMKEMDRSCQKERHIVDSIAEEQAPQRIGSYRAIALKRERAKLVWALARDPRESVRALASKIITEFFQQVAGLERAKEISAAPRTQSGLHQDVELARTLQEQAEQLSDATSRVSHLQTELSTFQEDRARLVVEIGAKERQIKEASEAREGDAAQIRALRERLAQVESEERETQRARAREAEARAVAEDLQRKVHRLEKLAGAAETLEETRQQLNEAQRRNEELVRQMSRADLAFRREREDLDKERFRLRAELDAAKDALLRARDRVSDLARLERRWPPMPPPEAGEEARLVVLLDQANLARTAQESYGRKVNFTKLLDQLSAGRRLEKAVAFVVDNGGAAFGAFCDVLRRTGWEVRIKRPKRFSDGSTKADWDMGMAMEAIELRKQASILSLVSGDGDFTPLVKYLQRNGAEVEVASFPAGLAGELAAAADHVRRLEESTLE